MLGAMFKGDTVTMVAAIAAASIYGLAVLFGLLEGALDASFDKTKREEVWREVGLFDTPVKKLLFVWAPAFVAGFWLFGGFRRK